MSGGGLDAVVIGAGAAGLAAALELRARGRQTLLLEAGARPGGAMQSDSLDGFTFERGPSSFRVSAAALALLSRAGAADALLAASPEQRERFLLGGGGLLRVPANPLAFAASPLLSAAGKLRLLAEPFVRRGQGAGESVAEFITRRLGAETLARLAAPALTGIYAGDERQLGAEAVFPSLLRFERDSGSIALGALRAALGRRPGLRRAGGLRGSWSARGGFGALANALANPLGEAVRLGARVRALEIAGRGAHGSGWRVVLDDETLSARALLLAVDAPAAAQLLQPLAPEAASGCAQIRYAPLVSLALDCDPHPKLRGLGFLAPRELGAPLLGALFMSRLFPERAPEGRELVTAMLGGARWPGAVDAGESTLHSAACAGIERALGPGANPRALAATRWRRAVPQPGPHHLQIVRDIRARLQSLPPIALAGGWLDGVALADAMESGVRAAAELSALHG